MRNTPWKPRYCCRSSVAMSSSSIRSSGFYLIGRVVRGDRDHAGVDRAVAPRVVGASLHDGIARLQVNLFGVEHECNLAFENEAKIERARLLHSGLRRARSVPEGTVRRQGDYAAKRAARRRGEQVREANPLARAVDSRWRRIGRPDEGRRK